jgi:hypothetical protein
MDDLPSLPSSFVPPCLPAKAQHPPTGAAWLHGIKHGGFGLEVTQVSVNLGPSWGPIYIFSVCPSAAGAGRLPVEFGEPSYMDRLTGMKKNPAAT